MWSAERPATFQTQAYRVVGPLRSLLREVGLARNDPTTHNVILDPYFLPRGIFGRTDKVSYAATRNQLMAQYRLEDTRDYTVTDFDPEDEVGRLPRR